MSDIVVALSTVPAGFDAGALARALVDSGVAACVTILPTVRSVYRWEGEVQEELEQQLIIKTTRDGVGALWEALKSQHPYDVPEFVVLPVGDGNPDYLQWVRDEVGSVERLP
jgi:periplasmic divalent cation tolerance protein